MRLRLLPVAIIALVLMLGVKVGGLWTGLLDAGVQPSLAQQPPAPEAQTPPAAKPPAATEASGKSDPKSGAKPAAKSAKSDLPSDPTLFTQAEIDLLQKLAERHAELNKWAQQIEMREGLLVAAEQRIDRKVGELRQIQNKIQGMLKTYEKEQEAKLKSLVKIYESMKPKEAARIFMELEMPVLLDVVERMREAKAAAIISKLEPTKAKDVTVDLAARRKIGAEAKEKVKAAEEARPTGALPSSGNPPKRPPVKG